MIANGDTVEALGVLLLEEGEQQVDAQRNLGDVASGKQDIIQVVVITTFASNKVSGMCCPF